MSFFKKLKQENDSKFIDENTFYRLKNEYENTYNKYCDVVIKTIEDLFESFKNDFCDYFRRLNFSISTNNNIITSTYKDTEIMLTIEKDLININSSSCGVKKLSLTLELSDDMRDDFLNRKENIFNHRSISEIESEIRYIKEEIKNFKKEQIYFEIQNINTYSLPANESLSNIKVYRFKDINSII